MNLHKYQELFCMKLCHIIYVRNYAHTEHKNKQLGIALYFLMHYRNKATFFNHILVLKHGCRINTGIKIIINGMEARQLSENQENNIYYEDHVHHFLIRELCLIVCHCINNMLHLNMRLYYLFTNQNKL